MFFNHRVTYFVVVYVSTSQTLDHGPQRARMYNMGRRQIFTYLDTFIRSEDLGTLQTSTILSTNRFFTFIILFSYKIFFNRHLVPYYINIKRQFTFKNIILLYIMPN